MRNKKKEKLYVDALIKELLDWVYSLGPDPILTSAFFSKKQLPFYRFNILRKHYPELRSAYQEVCTQLCLKWFEYLMNDTEKTPSQEKMAIFYMKRYDADLWQESEDRWKDRLKVSASIHEQSRIRSTPDGL